jgi:hypothetical protein
MRRRSCPNGSGPRIATGPSGQRLITPGVLTDPHIPEQALSRLILEFNPPGCDSFPKCHVFCREGLDQVKPLRDTVAPAIAAAKVSNHRIQVLRIAPHFFREGAWPTAY